MRFVVRDGELDICEEEISPCKFCQEYEESLKLSTNWEHANTHFKVCLYVYWTRNRKLVSRHMHKPMKLNYCPECGKKLKGVPR